MTDITKEIKNAIEEIEKSQKISMLSDLEGKIYDISNKLSYLGLSIDEENLKGNFQRNIIKNIITQLRAMTMMAESMFPEDEEVGA
jgi:preprotein translocase subunit YajC